MTSFYVNTFLALINATLAVGDINNIIKNGPDPQTVIFLTFRLLIVIFITTLNFEILKRHQKVFNSLEVKTYDLPKHIAKLHK